MYRGTLYHNRIPTQSENKILGCTGWDGIELIISAVPTMASQTVQSGTVFSLISLNLVTLVRVVWPCIRELELSV